MDITTLPIGFKRRYRWGYPLRIFLLWGLACFGVFLIVPVDQRIHWLILVVILYISGLHALVFGHSRYHLPLMPLIILYAAAALAHQNWRQLRESAIKICGLILILSGLLFSWGREVLVVEADRVKSFMSTLLG